LYIESDITINQWDFYRSSNAFIEDKRPSYLVQSDRNWGLNLGVPIGRRGKLVLGGAYVVLKDEYYQSTDFTQQDTADVTFFRGGTAFLSAERNTLNRKLYATEGTYLAASARYVSGDEQAIPGSTSLNKTVFNKYHNWYQFKGTYQNFYKHRGNLRLGFLMEGVFNTKPYFNNYSASALSSPAFYPLSDSKTFFIETFRAHIYIALGTINVITLRNNLDFRLEGYVFQPQQEILKGDNLLSSSGRPFDRRYFIGSANLVYNSPIGPISLSANYYEGLPNPVSVLFHFGYILFNKRALD
jgi:NTE family protein